MKHLRIAIVVLGGLILGTVSVASADKKSDAAQARQYYEDGTKYYSLGDFARAIENYKKAFELKEDPVFLYNIAQAYRLSSDYNQALFFYKSFLRNLPDAPNRGEVEGRIKEMEELKRLKESATNPPNDTVGPGARPPVTTTTTTTTTTLPGTTATTTVPGETGTTPDTKIPSPTDVAEGSETGVTTNTAPELDAPADAGTGGKPIYKKWWFWAGIGAVAAGAAVAVVVSSGGGGASAPSSHFGSVKVF